MLTDTATYYERELLRLVAEDDELAFRELFNRYKDKVYKLAHFLSLNTQWAEDTVQDIFLKLWSGRHEISRVDYLSAYLATMTRNHVMNLFRKQAAEQLMRTNVANETRGGTPDVEQKLAYRELELALSNAMQLLTPHQRKVFEASKLRGLRNAEMAEEFGMTIETVKKHLTNAMTIMRKELLDKKGSAEIMIALFIMIS